MKMFAASFALGFGAGVVLTRLYFSRIFGTYVRLRDGTYVRLKDEIEALRKRL